MLLFILAAFGQAASAETGTREELINCAAAALQAPAGEVSAAVPASWYVMAAMRADPQPAIFYQRIRDLTAEATARGSEFRESGALAGRAEAVRSECDSKYPRARAPEPARLPADPVERDILCYSMIVFFKSLGLEETPDGRPGRARLEQAERSLEDRLGAARLDAAGISGVAALIRRSDELMLASVDLGNSETISRACLAEPGG
jgi:hypothetical protein